MNTTKPSLSPRASRDLPTTILLLQAEAAVEQIPTCEAATLLDLCRARVELLCDRGTLGPVVATPDGGRWIYRSSVMAYRDEHLRRRAALDAINELVAPLLEVELAEAMAAFEREGWRFVASRTDKGARLAPPSKKSARDADRLKSSRASKTSEGRSTNSSDQV